MTCSFPAVSFFASLVPDGACLEGTLKVEEKTNGKEKETHQMEGDGSLFPGVLSKNHGSAECVARIERYFQSTCSDDELIPLSPPKPKSLGESSAALGLLPFSQLHQCFESLLIVVQEHQRDGKEGR